MSLDKLFEIIATGIYRKKALEHICILFNRSQRSVRSEKRCFLDIRFVIYKLSTA